MITKKFIRYNQYDNFIADLQADNIPDTAIVFVKDKKLIYTGGTYYYAVDNDEITNNVDALLSSTSEILERNEQADNDIAELKGNVSALQNESVYLLDVDENLTGESNVVLKRLCAGQNEAKITFYPFTSDAAVVLTDGGTLDEKLANVDASAKATSNTVNSHTNTINALQSSVNELQHDGFVSVQHDGSINAVRVNNVVQTVPDTWSWLI